MNRETLSAPVFNIARASLSDGPGLRTVLYLKGCPLRCAWCHNPEGLSPFPQILYHPQKCIGCGRCAEACPEHHLFSEEGHVFHRDGCAACGRCAELCPTEALSLCGQMRTVDEAFIELMRDEAYYHATGGGVTISGGECLMHAEFVRALLLKCQERGVGTCIETSLCAPWSAIERVLPVCTVVYADLKLADPQAHARYTGADNARILENMRRAAQTHNELRVRVPLIPGVNDGEENLLQTAAIVNTLGAGVRVLELLRYNPTARSKYDALGGGFHNFGEEQTDARMRDLRALVRQALRADIALI